MSLLNELIFSGEDHSDSVVQTFRGILVEVWKITKVLDFKIHPAQPGQVLPSITFEDKKQLSEDELKTREYDALAFRLVGMVAVPVLAAYAAYSCELPFHCVHPDLISLENNMKAERDLCRLF